jgi:tRNA pseudouridine32 synthase/23S rRNA pseudouridine746 synthase
MQSPDHKQMSQDLQLWLFRQYKMLNARGEEKDLVDIWHDYHSSPRIRQKFPLPPGGTGDCCAPKLLQYAYQHHLKPVCMAEFWWGESPKSEIRHHEQFYPACRGKCKPVLTWMMQGLNVAPNPEEAGLPHLTPEIVYEDEVMAVLNKPTGMLSVPGKTNDYSVATWAQKRWSDAMIVHRLDMGTSGLIVVAKTKEAYLTLQEQFASRSVKKKYLAIVEGTPLKEHGIIDLPLLPDPMNRPRQIVDHEHGKRAITEYRVLSEQGDGSFVRQKNRPPVLTPVSILALWPHTGRTHQLRMHCAHPEGLGCPILGDELYGRKADRLYLQAQAITLIHPTTGKRMHFELTNNF